MDKVGKPAPRKVDAVRERRAAAAGVDALTRSAQPFLGEKERTRGDELQIDVDDGVPARAEAAREGGVEHKICDASQQLENDERREGLHRRNELASFQAR